MAEVTSSPLSNHSDRSGTRRPLSGPQRRHTLDPSWTGSVRRNPVSIPSRSASTPSSDRCARNSRSIASPRRPKFRPANTMHRYPEQGNYCEVTRGVPQDQDNGHRRPVRVGANDGTAPERGGASPRCRRPTVGTPARSARGSSSRDSPHPAGRGRWRQRVRAVAAPLPVPTPACCQSGRLRPRDCAARGRKLAYPGSTVGLRRSRRTKCQTIPDRIRPAARPILFSSRRWPARSTTCVSGSGRPVWSWLVAAPAAAAPAVAASASAASVAAIAQSPLPSGEAEP
jgi:hypothetical protein